MLFLELESNNTIQYSFVFEDQHVIGLPNFVASTTCSAPNYAQALALTKLNSTQAHKAFYNAM